MSSLSDLCYEKLLRILPQDCLDKLREKDVNSRSVWIIVHDVFSSYEAAIKYRDTCYIEPLRVLLKQPPTKYLYIYISGKRSMIDGDTGVKYISLITTFKKEFKATDFYQINATNLKLKRYKCHLVGEKWTKLHEDSDDDHGFTDEDVDDFRPVTLVFTPESW